MAWTLTDDISAYHCAAEPFLAADPERHTVLLSTLARLRRLGPAAFGVQPPLLGWWSSSGRVRAAVLQTPPRPMLITPLPGASADELAGALVARRAAPPAVNGAEADAEAFGRAWSALTAQGYQVRQRQRLHRLGTLVPPDPAPAGEARVATRADAGIVTAWYQAFAVETGQEAGSSERLVGDRLVGDQLDAGQIMLWQVAGEPVSMAGVTEAIAGVARVAPVYTPTGARGAGYGGAVTAAVSRLALERGASSVVLFTDKANLISNALYLKLGYLPIEDRVVLVLNHPDPVAALSNDPKAS
jgi:predicted GNAT family acetyltransferase